jgi:hypothetical protein
MDVDFTNAFNAMSRAALWKVMLAYGVPDVDLLESLYEHSTVTLVTDRGKKLRVSQGLRCEVRSGGHEEHQAADQGEFVGQFNLIGFVDDLSLFAQSLGDAQAL